MNLLQIIGYLICLAGAGLMTLCAFLQGIPEFSSFAHWLLWGLPIGLITIFLGLWLHVAAEETE